MHTATESGADENGHGTMVAAIALYGDVRRCLESGSFSSGITLYSARILNEHNEFDDEELFATQMRKSIATFHAEPYNCRVFNVSIGRHDAHLASSNKQGAWAEVLDTLAREYKVVIVVSAGNHGMGAGKNSRQAAEVLDEYPGYLVNQPECGLCDPGTSSIAITVGGIAASDRPAADPDSVGESICRPVARRNEPYPGTRVGPGVNDAIKPEFVDNAGNMVLQGSGPLRRVEANEGTSVLSFAHNWIAEGNLFAFTLGTSFAAPAVSRVASLVTHRLRDTFGASR